MKKDKFKKDLVCLMRGDRMPKKAKKEDNKEVIGFHKGALDTLIKERQELLRIIGIVEQLISMHIQALKELGVDLQKEQKEQEQKKKRKKPIDEALREL